MMSNQFVDGKSGRGTQNGTTARDYFGNNGDGGLQFTTKFDTCTVGQIQCW